MFPLILMILIANISAEIVITSEPKELYNINDVVQIPIKVVATKDIQEFLSINLLCPGKETEVHKEYLVLDTGAEEKINSYIPLINLFVGESTGGKCKIKASLGEEFALTKEFQISNLITITPKIQEKSLAPEEILIIEGEAIKENKEKAEGFVELKIINDNTAEEKILTETINKGYFYIEYNLPEDIAAGTYTIDILGYEKNSVGEITNQGTAKLDFSVKQIPENLEIVLEKKAVNPSESLKVKAVLHDQTGEKIESTAIISLKDSENKIRQQKEVKTDKFLEYSIKYNEKPSIWKIVAVSNKLTAESEFNISEKEYIDIELINRTLILTNKGNIPYNNTITTKIGNEEKTLEVFLEIDETKKYKITAPNGEYQVSVITDGKERVTQKVALIGKAIAVEEERFGLINIARYPFIWIFITAILGFVAFMFYKKGYQRSFFGKIIKRKKKNPEAYAKKTEKKNDKEKRLFDTENIAELSLSMKGNKQNTSVICLQINNIQDLIKNKISVKENLDKIVKNIEKSKAYIYENGKNIFIILSPLTTKTFQNEKTAVLLAQKIDFTLKEHNKLYKQKIEYGISIEFGSIIAKKQENKVHFMSTGSLITNCKKIASLSKQEILLGKDFKEKAAQEIKTEKQTKNNIDIYKIKEIKNKEEHSKFIENFLKRNSEKK